MGTKEEGKDAMIHAIDELREETGLKTSSLTKLGEFFVDPGLSRQKCFAYAAEDIVEKGEQELEETEQGMEAKKILVKEIPNMIKKGEIIDSWGYSGFYLLETYLEERRKKNI